VVNFMLIPEERDQSVRWIWGWMDPREKFFIYRN